MEYKRANGSTDGIEGKSQTNRRGGQKRLSRKKPRTQGQWRTGEGRKWTAGVGLIRRENWPAKGGNKIGWRKGIESSWEISGFHAMGTKNSGKINSPLLQNHKME